MSPLKAANMGTLTWPQFFVPPTVALTSKAQVDRASWVLNSETLAAMFSTSELVFDSEEAQEITLQLYRTDSADLADYLHICRVAICIKHLFN